MFHWRHSVFLKEIYNLHHVRTESLTVLQLYIHNSCTLCSLWLRNLKHPTQGADILYTCTQPSKVPLPHFFLSVTLRINYSHCMNVAPLEHFPSLIPICTALWARQVICNLALYWDRILFLSAAYHHLVLQHFSLSSFMSLHTRHTCTSASLQPLFSNINSHLRSFSERHRSITKKDKSVSNASWLYGMF